MTNQRSSCLNGFIPIRQWHAPARLSASALVHQHQRLSSCHHGIGRILRRASSDNLRSLSLAFRSNLSQFVGFPGRFRSVFGRLNEGHFRGQPRRPSSSQKTTQPVSLPSWGQPVSQSVMLITPKRLHSNSLYIFLLTLYLVLMTSIPRLILLLL